MNATDLFVAWGRSSSSCVLVWIASVGPLCAVMLTLPLRERPMFDVDVLIRWSTDPDLTMFFRIEP